MVTSILAVVVLALYVVSFGFVFPRAGSIYGFVALWLFFPKIILRHPVFNALGLPEVPAYQAAVAPAAALAIVLALVFRRDAGSWLTAPVALRRLALLFLAAGAVSAVSTVIIGPFRDLPEVIHYGWRGYNEQEETVTTISLLLDFLPIAYGFVLLCGAMAFVRTLKQVEVVFALFLAAGIQLTAEAIVFVRLRKLPALHPAAVHASGRLQGVTHNQVDVVGVVAVLAFCAALYFALARGPRIAAVATPILLLPAIATYEKAPLASALLAVMVLFWTVAAPLVRAAFAVASVVGVSLVTLLVNVSALAVTAASRLGGSVRPDYFSVSSWSLREALWARALDVFVYWFPFGVGPGVVRYAMRGPAPQYTLPALPADSFAEYYYFNLAAGIHVTTTHNLYIEFTAEHGLLGLAALASFCALVFQNYLRSLGDRASDLRARTARAVTYSMLAGLGLFYGLESGAALTLYFLLGLLLHVTFLLAPGVPTSVEPAAGTPGSDCAPSRAR